MTFWKRQNYRNRKQLGGCQEIRVDVKGSNIKGSDKKTAGICENTKKMNSTVYKLFLNKKLNQIK